MRKAVVALVVACSGAALFAQTVERRLGIHEVPRFVHTEMVRGLPYTLEIEGGFAPEEVTYEEIDALSIFMEGNRANRLLGPIEYIYFDGIQSPQAFYEMRQRIEAAREKYVCVDLTHSGYYYPRNGPYPLPDGCFAGHGNLCWIRLGSFLYEQVPEDFCRGCGNLQFVVMWQWGAVAPSAFRGVGRQALLYDGTGRSLPLRAALAGGSAKLLTPLRDAGLVHHDGWDYRAFTGD